MRVRWGDLKLRRSMVMGLGVSGLAFSCIPIVALGRPAGNAGDTTMIQVKKVGKEVPPGKAVATVNNSYSGVTGVTTEYNSGAADYKGFTISAGKPLFSYFLLEGNYGYTSAEYITAFKGDNGTVAGGMPRPNVPRYTANLALNYARGPLSGSLGSHFVGRQYIAYNGGVTSTTTLPAYATVDLNLTYTWRPHDGVFRKVEITGYSDNLLDERHIVYAYMHGYQGGSNNYEQVQEGAPCFVGVTLTALF